jgi:ribosomal protein L10
MDRTQKAETVTSLNGLFSNAGAVIVAHYGGMTVAQMGDLRGRLRKAGASFRVAKNRLAVRALEGTQAQGLVDLFKGPTGIAYSNDPIAAPKVLIAYAKENNKLQILGGVQDHRPLAGARDKDRWCAAGARRSTGPSPFGLCKTAGGIKKHWKNLKIKPI